MLHLDEIDASPLDNEIHMNLQWGTLAHLNIQYPYFYRFGLQRSTLIPVNG